MACNNPLFRLPATLVEAVPPPFRNRIRNKGVIMNRSDRDYLINVWNIKEDYIQQIPCGQCSACRLEYSRQWAIRCMLEADYHDNNYFITLTYDDENLPKGYILDNQTGELLSNSKGYIHCLDDTDATKFIKRLRITFERQNLMDKETKLTYYYCGEYGEQYFRPHFHFLIYGLNIPDLELSHIRNGYRYYTSELLSKIWGKGIVVIGELCFDTAAYVARYVMKKQKGKSAKEQKERLSKVIFNGKEFTKSEFRDEFCRMSRRPGIAKKYFEEHKNDIYLTDELFVKTSHGLTKVKPCRYYDKMFDLENPNLLSKIKTKRKSVGKARSVLRSENSSLSEEQYLMQMNSKKNMQVKKLKRDVN